MKEVCKYLKEELVCNDEVLCCYTPVWHHTYLWRKKNKGVLDQVIYYVYNAIVEIRVVVHSVNM